MRKLYVANQSTHQMGHSPMTMIDTLYDGHYKSREKLALELPKYWNQEAKELEAAETSFNRWACI